MSDDASNNPPPGPIPWATLLAAAVAIAVFFWPAALRALEYDRSLVVAGQWWRIVTGSWVHLSRPELFWNLAVLVPAGIWAERIRPGRARAVYLVASLFVGGVVYFFVADLGRFAGLSGVAAGMLGFLALLQLRTTETDRWFWRLVLALLALKIAAEAVLASRWFSHFPDPAVTAVPLMHLAGLAAGSVVLSFQRRRRLR